MGSKPSYLRVRKYKDNVRIIVTEKICNHCKELLPIENYGKRDASGDGFSNACRKCTSINRRIYQLEYRRRAAKEKVRVAEAIATDGVAWGASPDPDNQWAGYEQ